MCTNLHSSELHEPLTTLIFPNMYNNMLLGYEVLKFNPDTDETLEYEEEDILEHFKSFYDDISDEFKKYGRLKQLVVCSNYEPHLRGNVYVQYESEKDAQKAYESLNGRFYAGKPIYCYFTHVKKWRDAICSLFLKNKCSKGYKCKYLHTFQNPYNEFQLDDRSIRSYLTNRNTKDSVEWETKESSNIEIPNNKSWDDDLQFKENVKKKKKRSKSKERHRHDHHKKKSKKKID